jgi:redox-sensing transcriptional repressor
LSEVRATLCLRSQARTLELVNEEEPVPLKRLRLPRADARDRARATAPTVVAANGGDPSAAGVPEATVGRLPTYLQALHALASAGVTTVSSQELADSVHVSAAMLRKDLSHLGSYGTRGVGYDVATLVHEMSAVLGLEHDWPVAIVGVGNLGRALAHYGGFSSRGLSIAALFDADPAVVGTEVNGHTVHDVAEIGPLVVARGVRIAVVATPAAAAQGTCDALVAAGVTSILCFAGGTVRVPPGVTVRAVDLSSELQILGFHEQRKRSGVLADLPAVVRTVPTAGAVHGEATGTESGR